MPSLALSKKVGNYLITAAGPSHAAAPVPAGAGKMRKALAWPNEDAPTYCQPKNKIKTGVFKKWYARRDSNPPTFGTGTNALSS